MIICGVKLTHDGAIAVIENDKLRFSIEVEKLNNNKRYESIEDTEQIEEILSANGLTYKDIDHFVIDGWGGFDQDALAVQPRLVIKENHNFLSAYHRDEKYQLSVAQYQERSLKKDVLEEWSFNGLKIGEDTLAYKSYLHVTGHIMSAYCTSPIAKRNESSYILIWDGGMYPRLYYFNTLQKKIENLGPLFLLIGNIYTIFSQHFGPFKVENGFAKDDLSIAGKVMAYIALGEVQEDLFTVFDEIYQQEYEKPMGFANRMAQAFKNRIGSNGKYSDEDILHSFHAYIQKILIDKLKKKVNRYKKETSNLCIAGGCALNIKWNSAIRSSKLFEEVYIPPFPNDSGSAIGMACTAMTKITGKYNLDWSVYSGPKAIKNDPYEGWGQKECSVSELANLLHTENEPIVVLNGRSELGPRALGNRSIIAAPGSPEMKKILNAVKNREDYRPVSPICLEERATEIFSPGTPDPYMLFDHQVRDSWFDKIPAVRHLDGTSRLQTVSKEHNPALYELLSEFEKKSGIPVLCNTSANYNGHGFFPDIYSATKWNQVNFVWCNNTLFHKIEKLKFNQN